MKKHLKLRSIITIVVFIVFSFKKTVGLDLIMFIYLVTMTNYEVNYYEWKKNRETTLQLALSAN